LTKFTFIDLFAGVGGFRQALDSLGGECVFSSEIDKFAAQAYETLYGEKPAGDITQIDAKDIPNHDLLVGGFPCQAFSVAGKRKGFEDTRGTLFFEIAIIAKEKRPKALLLENVKGLVNHDKGRTLDVMIETLNEIGYIVDFEILNSKYFGVPQNRERIFIIAVREGLIEQSPWIIEGNTIVPKGKRRISEYHWAKTFNFDWPEQTEVTTRLRDILETEVDEKYYLDEEKTAKLIAQLDETLPAHFPTPNDVNNTLRTGGKGSLTAKHNYDHIAEPQMLGHVDIKGHDAIRRVYSAESVGPTLTTMGGGHREPKIAEQQGVAIREATKKGYAIAEEGDSVNVQFPGSKTRRGRVGKRIANTLEASNINQGTPIKDGARYRIRKLTPRECFRLQNFPDEAFDKLKDAGISDSQLYKMSGNAITTSVVEAIGERLIPLITAN